MTLTIGQAAPDFEIPNQHGEKVSLSSFKGQKNVLLMFYPFSFTGTCTGELCALRDDLSSFQNDDLQLLAISCDSPFTQRVFAEQENYQFPVLSDFWPHGAVASAYGVFEESKGCALRGSFLAARENADYKAAIAAL
jgi:peroxiredoxin